MSSFRSKFGCDFGIDWGQHFLSSSGTEFRRVRNYYKEEFDKAFLSTYRYRCPFNMVTEFDQWFEWQRWVHFDSETTGEVTVNMLYHDRSRLMASKIEEEMAFRISLGLGMKPFDSRRVLITNSGS